jgi:haloalkane dehalogenase
VKALRTPDDRFASLPGYAFEPRYADVRDGLRAHYVDVGPADANPVLLMHGEPSWSFLYRKMIPILARAGHRCIAPDLIGFGRSDKPVAFDDYTYQRHIDWMSDVVFGHLDLHNITFFGQDWGGLIGLRLVCAEPDRFARVVIGNTGLPTGDIPPSKAFLAWQTFAKDTPDLPIGAIVSGGCATRLDDAVVAAYDAPFPDNTYKAGARAFPVLVPTSPDDPAHDANTKAWEVLRSFDRPFLCAFSDGDPITKGADQQFLREVPGAAGQVHTTIEGGGHFLQEDKGEDLARVTVDFIAST